MGADDTGRWLELLTRLGHRLPLASRSVDACEEVTAAFGALGFAVCTTLIEGDSAEVVSIQVPEYRTRLSPTVAARLAGVRVPVEGVDCLRHPVRLRRPYLGRAGAVQTLRSVTNDSGLSHGLPQPWDEDEVVAVPVTALDRVLAVITAWGPGADLKLVPTLEAAAAMLASALRGETDPAIDRFTAVTNARASDQQLRGELLQLLDSDRLAAAVQPIVRLYDSTVIGYEALTRFA
ncbi:MAG TPA: hypothetical protein VFA70_09945, partial [Dehalococcoidia bacterium]|nr:hypothetical protein [Dehalococcoidia bacterium]